MVKHYNDQFAPATVNDYYMPPVAGIGRDLKKTFDGLFYGLINDKKDNNDDDDDDDSKKYKMAINDEPVKKTIQLKRAPSYNETPAYNSDIGISEIDEAVLSETEEKPQKGGGYDNNPQQAYGQPDIPEEEEKYPTEKVF